MNETSFKNASPLLSTNTLENTTGESLDNELEFDSLYSQYEVTHMLWLTVPPLLLVLGCFGNVMTILVMRAMRAAESTACLSVYFTALAVSDLFVLTTSVLWDWPNMAFNEPIPFVSDLQCMIPFFVLYASSMTSAWLLVAMTCQRLISVVLPHRVVVLCTVRRGKIITAVIIMLVCVINIYFFFTYHLENVDNIYKECVSINENMAYVLRLMDLFLASAIPFLFLIIANSILIYRTVQAMRKSLQMTVMGDQQTASQSAKISSMTRTLILTSVAFLVLTLPTCVLDIYLEAVGFYRNNIEDENTNEMLTVAETICIFLWIGNSAINFYIYVLSGSKFRQETKWCFRWCLKNIRPKKPLEK